MRVELLAPAFGPASGALCEKCAHCKFSWSLYPWFHAIEFLKMGSFSGSDLLLLAKLADLAHTEAEELRRADEQADESAA